jgi:hypothetical protein
VELEVRRDLRAVRREIFDDERGRPQEDSSVLPRDEIPLKPEVAIRVTADEKHRRCGEMHRRQRSIVFCDSDGYLHRRERTSRAGD